MSAPILETRQLSKTFGGVKAIDRIDFSLAPGELRCLIGPNGAGKSTFFKMLTGQHRPDGGQVLLNGQDITAAAAHEIGRLGIGIKNQIPDVFDGLSVAENLTLAARFILPKAAAARKVAEVLARVQLEPMAGRLVGELAHGQRQWVEIAMVVAREPILVLLDEPSAGMSVEETARTAELIREINREATVVAVEHNMQFIRSIASRVTVFHRGRILVEENVDKALSDRRVRDVYLGRSAA
ncbi:MAG: ATP-binding cassette domain-containing protein [Rhodospirillales bacterium]|nr:ATP-binding cassette domain-containing protein [Rhodospirillales bacterium]